MKAMIRFFVSGMIALVLESTGALAQKIDDERMVRDIEVGENILTTLIKQQLNNQRTFFPLEIRGSYQAGYGVTFALPADYTTPIAFINIQTTGTGTISSSWEDAAIGIERRDNEDAVKTSTYKLKGKEKEQKSLNLDSVRDAYSLQVIEAAKTFIVDYGDMMTQLGPQEKIVITNQGNQPRAWVNRFYNAPKRTHLSIEATKADLIQFKQGKITRDQALAKIKVVNTESVDTVEADLELLASIFNRLYRMDLSKTYFADDNLYYERLKDFGVIYYMQVYSAIERDYRRYAMPTLGLDNVDQATRDKKITELYPKFEQETKENILDYGRTLKSLKDDEVLIFQIRMTQCEGCGIPSSLEFTIKSSDLKDFASGKTDKSKAMTKLTVKKGANQ